jgi:hypothetical protein
VPFCLDRNPKLMTNRIGLKQTKTGDQNHRHRKNIAEAYQLYLRWLEMPIELLHPYFCINIARCAVEIQNLPIMHLRFCITGVNEQQVRGILWLACVEWRPNFLHWATTYWQALKSLNTLLFHHKVAYIDASSINPDVQSCSCVLKIKIPDSPYVDAPLSFLSFALSSHAYCRVLSCEHALLCLWHKVFISCRGHKRARGAQYMERAAIDSGA